MIETSVISVQMLKESSALEMNMSAPWYQLFYGERRPSVFRKGAGAEADTRISHERLHVAHFNLSP